MSAASTSMSRCAISGAAAGPAFTTMPHNFIFAFPDPEPTLTVRGRFRRLLYRLRRNKRLDSMLDINQFAAARRRASVIRGDNSTPASRCFKCRRSLALVDAWHLFDWGD
jgi:hypothetical protein